MIKNDPGVCPICGAAHTACTTDTGPITMTQLPARDAQTPVEPTVTEFSTATYRGKPKK